jgi:predicted nucleic-acid-binding Zn-ribbon protein
MATFFTSLCETCGYGFESSGLHEFYRDCDGELRDYGHPLPSSKEAEAAGVRGLYARAWCMTCDKHVDVIVREFERPLGPDDSVWARGTVPEKQVAAVCPACGDDNPVTGDTPFGMDFPCPKCGGTIHAEKVRWT